MSARIPRDIDVKFQCCKFFIIDYAAETQDIRVFGGFCCAIEVGFLVHDRV